MLTGTVKSYFVDRGFGWVTRDDNNLDIFVHINQVIGKVALSPGDRVKFEAAKNKRNDKWNAVNVEVIDAGTEDEVETVGGGRYTHGL